MEAFREGLRIRGLPDIRSAVLDDLSSFYQIDAEEALYRATHSFELSAAEWRARPERVTKEDITDFYLNIQAWSFGLLWFAYLQAEGYAPPVAVMIAQDMPERPPAHVLDFGAGVGAAGAMFSLLGYTTTLADIATPMLKFAEHRFQRRGIAASFIDLNQQPPPRSTYDVIAAIQVFASVPDVRDVALSLHRALKPGGTLYADFDARPRTGADSRLYDDDLPVRRQVQDVGFVQERSVEQMTLRFHQVSPRGPAHTFRRMRDSVVLGSPRRYWRRLRYR